MQMEIRFPGGKKVDAAYKGFTVQSDQPKDEGGDQSAPEPFDLFLASIGTCAGVYALSFCQARHVDTEQFRMVVDFEKKEKSNLLDRIRIKMFLPPGFPKEYVKAITRSASLCTVKKQMASPPRFDIEAEIGT